MSLKIGGKNPINEEGNDSVCPSHVHSEATSYINVSENKIHRRMSVFGS